MKITSSCPSLSSKEEGISGGSPGLGFPGGSPGLGFPGDHSRGYLPLCPPCELSYTECLLCAGLFVCNAPFSPHDKPVRGRCYF